MSDESKHSKERETLFYMPSYLPVSPAMTDKLSQALVESWAQATSPQAPGFVAANQHLSKLGQPTFESPVVMLYSTFYQRFFLIAPEVKSMFKREMHSQGMMLTNILTTLVSSVEKGQTGEMVEGLKHAATKHNRYGVMPYQYACVGEALLYALQMVLQDQYTSDMHEAWLNVYGVMMSVMIPIAIEATHPKDGDPSKAKFKPYKGIVPADTLKEHLSQLRALPKGKPAEKSDKSDKSEKAEKGAKGEKSEGVDQNACDDTNGESSEKTEAQASASQPAGRSGKKGKGKGKGKGKAK